MTASPFEKRFPPGAIIRVPGDRRLKAVLEIVQRFPVQLALRERGVDVVMARVRSGIEEFT